MLEHDALSRSALSRSTLSTSTLSHSHPPLLNIQHFRRLIQINRARQARLYEVGELFSQKAEGGVVAREGGGGGGGGLGGGLVWGRGGREQGEQGRRRKGTRTLAFLAGEAVAGVLIVTGIKCCSALALGVIRSELGLAVEGDGTRAV